MDGRCGSKNTNLRGDLTSVADFSPITSVLIYAIFFVTIAKLSIKYGPNDPCILSFTLDRPGPRNGEASSISSTRYGDSISPILDESYTRRKRIAIALR